MIRILAESICSGACPTGLPHVAANGSQLPTILQIVFGVAAALAVLMVVIGGLRLVTSEGDPQAAAKGRMTILYAVVGLAISVSAELIVSFVLRRAA